jgi:FkbM family methyltransferase
MKTLLRESLRSVVRHMPKGGSRLVGLLNPYLATDEMIPSEFDGQKVELSLRDHIQQQLYFFGGFESEETAFFTHYIREGMTFVDVGANIGVYTLLGAKRVGAAGKVIAFEPVPATFRLLKRNVELNGWANVVLEQLGISQAEGVTEIYIPAYNNMGVPSIGKFQNRSPWKETIPIRTVTLDRYASEHQIARVNLVKMDIQGAEIFALRGMRRLLSEPPGVAPDLMCELHPGWLEDGFGSSPEEVRALLREHGYSMYEIAAPETLKRIPPGARRESNDMMFCTKVSEEGLRAAFGYEVV